MGSELGDKNCSMHPYLPTCHRHPAGLVRLYLPVAGVCVCVCLCGMGVPGSNGSTFLFTFWTQGGTTEGAYTSAEAETVVDSEKKLGMSCAGPGMQL